MIVPHGIGMKFRLQHRILFPESKGAVFTDHSVNRPFTRDEITPASRASGDGNHFEALESAVQSGDLAEAERMAHTLKGVGANLSLSKLTVISANMEQLIKNGQDHTACLAELKSVYDVTLEKIAEVTG